MFVCFWFLFSIYNMLQLYFLIIFVSICILFLDSFGLFLILGLWTNKIKTNERRAQDWNKRNESLGKEIYTENSSSNLIWPTQFCFCINTPWFCFFLNYLVWIWHSDHYYIETVCCCLFAPCLCQLIYILQSLDHIRALKA